MYVSRASSRSDDKVPDLKDIEEILEDTE